MSPKPPVSLWPDPEALGPLTDLYRAHHDGRLPRRGDGRPDGVVRVVRAQRCRRAGHSWSLPGSSRRSATCSSWRSTPSRSTRSAAGRHFRSRPRGDGQARRARDSRATSTRCPRERSSFRARPLLRVEAPLPQAQWVETHLLASLAYPTLVASKAARIVAAAGGRSLFEFGARRGHGPLAGLLAARSAMIAGFAGTSHVEAARRLGIPAVGTMAHSWIQSFADRVRSVRDVSPAFFPETPRCWSTPTTRSKACGWPPRSSRRSRPSESTAAISASLARQARAILDQHGRPNVKIVVSGDLDEYRIARARQLGCADRRLRSRNRVDHLPRRAGAVPWSTSSSSSTAWESSSSARARRPTRWPSRSSGAATAQAGFAATTSRGPTSRPKVSRSSCRSFKQAGWWLRCLRSKASAPLPAAARCAPRAAAGSGRKA